MIDFSYWPFFFLAMLGAVVANATGAGGGIVFVPAFNMLNLSGQQIIGTSFAIQCFGMTAGALAWYRYAKQQRQQATTNPPEEPNPAKEPWQQYGQLVFLFVVPSVVGVLLGQYVLPLDSLDTVKQVFKVFSAIFGVAILLTTVYLNRASHCQQTALAFTSGLRVTAMAVSLIGGLITAWLSIGVRELVAVMLILMRYPVRLAVGVAVTVSAISVWFGVQLYLWAPADLSLHTHTTINIHILVFAAPAAVIGGTVAKHILALFSPTQVKVFIAAWILLSAALM